MHTYFNVCMGDILKEKNELKFVVKILGHRLLLE